MNSYHSFAYLYDSLTKDIDYEKWADYIQEIFKQHGVSPGLVLELACGTGNITTKLSQRGYEMIGIDLSEDMLSVAKDKGGNILYLNQDITDFELYGTVDAILCLLDSVNYITDIEKLKNFFKLAKNYLNPGGIFIFDINSPYKFKEILADNTFVEDTGDIFYVWENFFDEEEGLCYFDLSFFLKKWAEPTLDSDVSQRNIVAEAREFGGISYNTKKGEHYKRFDEQHVERCYSPEFLTDIAKDAGFNCVGLYSEMSFNMPENDSERIFFVLR